MSKKENKNKITPLAIVGIGCLFPKADNPQEYWTNIREGVDAITDIPESHWNPSDYFDEDKTAPDMTYAKRGGFINAQDFNPLLYGLSPNNIEATDTTQLLGMVATRQALLDANYSTAKDAGDGREFDRDRTSVIMGVTGTLELVIPLGARLGHPIWRKALADAGIDPETTEDVVQRIADGYVPWQENSFPGLLGNVAAGRIANRFDFGGTNCVVDAACASSLSALHLAAMELTSGRVDMAITGGVDTFNDIFMYMCFSKTPALSPTGNSRPFAKEGDGTILGEGIGSVILKRLDDAKRDNDKIYAVLRGIGSSSDGRGNAIYAPSSAGQTKALWNAYREADVTPRSIELVEAHGTGTSVGDAVEATALSGVYSQDNEGETWCAVGSVKSMIGHTKAAAGVAGLIKTAMALKYKVLPPSIKVDEPLEIINPGTAPVYLNTVKRPWLKTLATPRRAALSSFGFGGSNFHCVLEEAEETKSDIEWDGQVLIIALSADSKEDLIKQLPEVSVLESWKDLRFFAYDSCQSFKNNAAHRLTLVIEKSNTVLNKLFGDVTKQLEASTETSWQRPDGVSYSSEKSPDNVAFVFPGQGSQYTGMCRDLACQFPQFLNALEESNHIFQEATGKETLGDVLYPIPVFSKADQKQQEETLRQTQNAQPAIGAVSLGALDVLNHFSVKAKAAIGHSYGELTALSAAGLYNAETLHRLSRIRGELMAAGEGDRGSMLAVVASYDQVDSLLKTNNIDLIIANHNSPTQVVLSGATDQVDAFSKIAKAEKIRAIKLPVAAAFHSSFVAEAAKPFAEALAQFEFGKNSYKVLSNTTTDAYPEDADAAKQLLANQLAAPVRFVEQVENLYADGFTTFVEVGPGKTLTGLINSILADKPVTTIAVDASVGKKQGQYDLALVLATLAVHEQEVELKKWDAACSELARPAKDAKPAMTIAISGANYTMPRKPRPASKPKPQPAVNVNTMTSEVKSNNSKQQNQQATSPVNTTVASSGLLQATQESILALQKMQEQTARLHQQYLEGQETAQKSIQSLLEQQQRLMSGQPLAVSVQQTTQVSAPVQVNTEIVKQEVQKTGAVQATPIKEIQETIQATPVQDEHPDVDINNLLLKVVSEKTGYPLEMLSLDMSLDTDLGIDSIKRVEILSALQEQLPWSQTVNPEELGTFQFLQHIVEFLAAGRPVGTTVTTSAEQTMTTTFQVDNNFAKVLLEIVSEKTGYPIDMLELDMNLDSDLGIDSIKRVEILSVLQEAMPELPTISPDELSQLETLRSITELFVSEQAVTSDFSASVSQTTNVISGFADTLLDVVSDKTGYPVDMLSLEMNLDSDLGIDSIKRVEILSTIQDQIPDLPSVSPDEMASLQTLKSIVDIFNVSSEALSSDQTTQENVASSDSNLSEVLLEVVADKTGYPVDMLNLEMNLDSDLGIDSIKRVEILSTLQDKMPELPTVSADNLAALQTLQQIIGYMNEQVVSGSKESPVTETKEENVESNKDSIIVRSVVRLADLEQAGSSRQKIEFNKDKEIWITEESGELAEQLAAVLKDQGYKIKLINNEQQISDELGALVICANAEADKQYLLNIFSLVQRCADQLKKSKGILASITTLGGSFGFENSLEGNPVQAGLYGIIKTADKEWPDVHCKSIDINQSSASVDLVQQELFLNGPLEVGLLNEQAREPILEEDTLSDVKQDKTLLNKDDFIVISGGARGVTADVAVKLAETYQCNLLLLGRSEEPKNEPEWLSSLTDAASIKKAIMENAEEKLRPTDLEKQYQSILANREIRNTIERIEQTGTNVEYASVDVTDTDAVSNVIDLARIELGNVTGIIHAAGVLADRLIEDKTEAQFESVYSTKVDGLQSLLAVTKNDNLKLIVLFSSTTARLGRKGQVDYTAANEILNKQAVLESQNRKDCKVLSVNWGPWDGGMVTPALKKLFAEEGVGVIGLKAGAEYLINEIESDGPVETVVLGESENLLQKIPLKNYSTLATESNDFSLSFEREVSVNTHPFLKSHVMNGLAVLPVAVIIEWFAHGALHSNPGMQFRGFDDFRVLKGVTLRADESIRLKIHAGNIIHKGDESIVSVELRSDDLLHASAIMILADSYESHVLPQLKALNEKYNKIQGEYYQNGQLFHGQALQGISEVTHCSDIGIVANVNAAPQPSAWMTQPIRSSWLTDPLVLDSAFQMMILWSFEDSGIPSLPVAIASYRQFQRSYPKDNTQIVIEVNDKTDHRANAAIEILDSKGELIALLDGYECVRDRSLQIAFKRNNLNLEIHQ
ncbi:MAG: SDR family NAD(P)-dependent oxidoreductase [Proteobacteria bacterium]|nr:SDR family NAD(P)-dependent oxidoreductase [Pseudomonadota bacterium]NOG59499.1 SDR family NAD(P)-dependent oxidoreductase [Pseudomonadota bacterium]